MKTPRTLPLKTVSLVAIAALMAAFVTTAKAAAAGAGLTLSGPQANPLDEGLTPAEKSRLSLDQLKALARRSLHQFTDDELLRLKKCREYSHLNPESCDPMILEANLAEARAIIAKGLPKSKRAGYAARVKNGSSSEVEAYLAAIASPEASPQPPTNVGQAPRKPRAPRVRVGVTQPPTKPQPPSEPVANPGGGAGATLDLNELDKGELENLTKAEQDAYRLSLDQAKGKKDPAGIAAVIAEYRQKASANRMLVIPKTVKEFDALAPAQQKLFCDRLSRAPDGGFVGGYQVITGAKNQAQAAAASSAAGDSILTGKASREGDTVAAAPPPHIPKTEVDKLRQACKDFLAGMPGGSQGNLTGSIPPSPGAEGDDCKEKKDGKCLPPKKDDPNEWLDVKAGAIGGVGGAVIGMLGGTTGVFLGAAIGFALFWGANKLLR